MTVRIAVLQYLHQAIVGDRGRWGMTLVEDSRGQVTGPMAQVQQEEERLVQPDEVHRGDV